MATGQKMTVADHARAALELLEHSDQEFVKGDEKQGSEKLWGSAAHSVMAIAMQRGWRYSKHNAKVAAVNRLAEEYGEPLWCRTFLRPNSSTPISTMNTWRTTSLNGDGR